MSNFVGRERELRSLTKEFDRVRGAIDSSNPGRCLLLRGRRRVGKSRLIEEFCQRVGAPYVFFTASQQGQKELDLFTSEIADSTLSGRDTVAGATPSDWDAALRLLGTAIGDDPSIVVIDELPYLVVDNPSIEGTLQKLWDRTLSAKPVLLLLVGSDVAMMEALNTHGRAFYQRGTELKVPPFSPVETAAIVESATPADAFDAFLITGGLPLICNEWPQGLGMWNYLEDALSEPTSALIISGERSLAAEFERELQARRVLEVIGTGERTFTNIGRESGISAMSLNRALDTLREKRVVARELPLSTKKGADPRYRIDDPYLRFWLTFIGPHLAEIERGRSDRVLARIRASWPSWRGRAIEPVVRDALHRKDFVTGVEPPTVIGSFWTRTNKPEVDIIGADRGPVAGVVLFAGSIKWLDNEAFDERDLRRLEEDVQAVPGCSSTTPLVAVSRRGHSVRTRLAAALGPENLLDAWR